MFGCVGGEHDQHESLRRNANGEGPVLEGKVLGGEGLPAARSCMI